MIDLKNFCAPEYDLRKYLHSPFRIGNHVYASNASIIIRVDATDEQEDTEHRMSRQVARFFPDLSMLENEFATFAPYLPERGEVCYACHGQGKVVTCKECGGNGEFEHGTFTYQCQACNGVGDIPVEEAPAGSPAVVCQACEGYGHRTTVFEYQGGKLVDKMARLILTLPNVRFAWSRENKDMAYLLFDGGQGTAMGGR